MTEELIHLAYDPEFDFRDLPKISLHDHLDGGLRPQTIIELAAEVGHTLPADDAESLGEWFRESADSGSLPRYLETFEHTIAVMQTKGALKRVASEFVEDLVADGVIYGEVRWAPEQHLAKGLSLDEAVEAVQAGLDEAVERLTEEGHLIQVGQLVTAMRHADRGKEIAELALRHRGDGVVGFDIAGAEEGFPPSRMAEAFDLLAENFFPTTVHAGEAAGIDSIKEAILIGRAQRLGHGVRIAEDITIEFGGWTMKASRWGRTPAWFRLARSPTGCANAAFRWKSARPRTCRPGRAPDLARASRTIRSTCWCRPGST